jgi:hypothetical protein
MVSRTSLGRARNGDGDMVSITLAYRKRVARAECGSSTVQYNKYVRLMHCGQFIGDGGLDVNFELIHCLKFLAAPLNIGGSPSSVPVTYRDCIAIIHHYLLSSLVIKYLDQLGHSLLPESCPYSQVSQPNTTAFLRAQV